MHVKKDEVMLSVFFFKQKTSYELRISDWSSDVCSSDREGADARQQITEREDALHPLFGDAEGRADVGDFATFLRQPGESFPAGHLVGREPRDILDQRRLDRGGIVAILQDGAGRSEEHTSELQSLMRISYAVFCFQK